MAEKKYIGIDLITNKGNKYYRYDGEYVYHLEYRTPPLTYDYTHIGSAHNINDAISIAESDAKKRTGGSVRLVRILHLY